MKDFVDIKGYEGLYAVNQKGDVWSYQSKCLISPAKDKDGYKRVLLYKDKKRKYALVHRIVYETFIGELQKGLVIDHINNDKSNNNVSNLQQVTNRVNSTKDVHNALGVGVHKQTYYIAKAQLGGKNVYLGSFKTEQEAKEAYNTAVKMYEETGEIYKRKILRNGLIDGTKVCTCCGERKPLSEYYYVRTQNFYHSKCKECLKKDKRDKYNNN